MAIKKYYDSDCNLGMLDGKTVAVIGFGSQGHAHSENLAESGVNVVVGLRKGSAHWEKAAKFAETCPNFHVMEVEEAAKAGDVVMMLVPDELCADIYNKQVAAASGSCCPARSPAAPGRRENRQRACRRTPDTACRRTGRCAS